MDLKNKPKLSVDSQIYDFMSKKKIKFTIMNKEEAKHFLTYNSYLFKIKAYAKNYSKNPDQTYINLEFAYLVDLSIIDMHLRKCIVKICLDIEHLLKTKLLRDFNNDDCDGYSIVDDFLKTNPRLKTRLEQDIHNIKQKSYTAKDNILEKYGINLSIWNFIEIIEFGNFINFCEYYYEKYPNTKFDEIKHMLWSAKCLRNSSAHNNCLINNLNVFPHFYPNFKIKEYLNKNTNLSKRSINKKLKTPFIFDFIAILLLFDNLCSSKKMKFNTYKEIIKLFNKRIKKNISYYQTNTLLKSSYEFVVGFLIFIVRNRHKIS